MSIKLVLVAVVATLTYHCVYGKSTANDELTETDREGKVLIEVPLIGTVLMVAFKIIGFLKNTIGPLIQYKLAAFTLVANITSWLHQNYFSVIIGTVGAILVLGYCVITGAFAADPGYEVDHGLFQTARQLEAGALKYARIIN